MLQKLFAGSLGIYLYALSATAAHAMLMDFTFDVTFDGGTLIGETYDGSFTVDGFTGSGLERFVPAGSAEDDATGELISLEIEIDGNTFTMADAFDFPETPIVDTLDGTVIGMFFITSSDTLPALTLNRQSTGTGELVQNVAEYTDATGAVSSGVTENFQPVPEPTTLALLSLSLAGLGFTRHRMKS